MLVVLVLSLMLTVSSSYLLFLPLCADFLFDLGRSQAALRLGLSWIGTPVPDDDSPLFPFKRRHPIAFEKSMLPYRVADTRSLPRSVGCFRFMAQVGPSSFVCEEALTKDGAPGRALLLQQWPAPSVKATTEGFALSSVRTIKALQELHLPKASEDAADAGKASKKLSKKDKKLKKHKKEKEAVADPRDTIAAGQSLVHVSRCPNLLLPLEIVVGSDTFPFPAGASPVPLSLPPDIAEAAQALLRGAFIVYEFAKHDVPGLLIGSVRLSADVPLSFRQKLSYQLALAVRRLHSRGLVAQSLNPSQLLMSSDGTLRFFRPDWPRSVPAESTDALSMLMAAPAHSFLSGLARFSASNKDAAFKVVSAPPHVHASLCAAEVMPFVAPEVLLGLPCGLPANDQWSLGACLYYIHTGACLISGATPAQVLDSAFALVGSPGTLVDGLPLWPAGTALPAFAATAAVPTVPTVLDYSLSCLCPELADLIRGLLRVHPGARLTSKQVLSHPYFTKFVPPGAVATPLAAEVPSLRMPLHPYLLHPLFR